jgi:diaminopimelate epimerase
MVASGNDFVVLEFSSSRVLELKRLAQRLCNRKYGVGADGLLILEKSKIADIKMRIFNADGSEAQMCGNGARCIALFKAKGKRQKAKVKIETKAGIIEARVTGDNVNPVRNTKSLGGKSKISNGVKIKLTDPKDIKLNLPIKVNNRTMRINFINTGVPHAVIFVEGLEKIDVANLGNQIRYHKRFAPQGTNVDFVEVLNNNAIKVRTYERGVEDETLACGTGAVASSLITATRISQSLICKINVHTQSKEILKVYFERIKDKFENVWLEGKARIVYRGVYDV